MPLPRIESGVNTHLTQHVATRQEGVHLAVLAHAALHFRPPLSEFEVNVLLPESGVRSHGLLQPLFV